VLKRDIVNEYVGACGAQQDGKAYLDEFSAHPLKHDVITRAIAQFAQSIRPIEPKSRWPPARTHRPQRGRLRSRLCEAR
jgi:hypothetical protein